MKKAITESDDEMQKVSYEYIKGSRKGDPRMNAAVQAKHADPTISLLDALLMGGFKFPGYDNHDVEKSKHGIEKTKIEQEIYDENGISMRQRKNQLGRRLRTLRCQQAKEEKAEQEQEERINRSSPLDDLSRASGEIASQNHNLLVNDGANPPKPSQIPPPNDQEKDLGSILAASSFVQNTSSIVDQQQILCQQNQLLPRDNNCSDLSTPHNLLTRSHSAHSSLLHPLTVPSQSPQVLSNALLRDHLQSFEQSSSYLGNYLGNRPMMDLLQTRNPSPRPASLPTVTMTPSYTYTPQQEEELQKHLLLSLKNEYIHKLARGQGNLNQWQHLFNQEEVQKLFSTTAYPSIPNTFVVNDLQEQLRLLLNSAASNSSATEEVKLGRNQEVVAVVEDDSSSYHKKNKRTRHSLSQETNSKKRKENDNNHDQAVASNASPRFLKAMQIFHNKFDAFTQSCLEEAGFTNDECLTLFQSFQKQVIRDTIAERK